MASPQNPTPGGCGQRVVLENGSFEQPRISDRAHVAFFDDASVSGGVPGWRTTASDHKIELWPQESTNFTAADGDQLAELNANETSTLYQDLPTTPGMKLYWKLSHRGRKGSDTMKVQIGPAPQGDATFTPNYESDDLTDGNTAWGEHSGTYTVPPGQSTTRFAFVSVSAAGGDTSVGNLLDNITFGTAPCVVLTKKASPGGELKIGDTITYEVTATNEGGSPADNLVLTDAVPAGTSFVPGSLRITDGLGAGDHSDQSGDDRASYDAASRTVTFHLGDGATSGKGGSLDPTTSDKPVSTTIQFSVKVERAGGGNQLENQATATYDNSLDTPTEHKTSTSNAVTTPVQRAVELALIKAADRTQVAVGELVTFHLIVTNNGPSDATGVTVTDKLPKNLKYVSASAIGDSSNGYDPGTGKWKVGALAPHASAHLQLQAVVTTPGPIRNTAIATANETSTDTSGTGTGTSTVIMCAHPQPPCPPPYGGGWGGGGWGGNPYGGWNPGGWNPGGWNQGGWNQGGCSPAPCPDTCGHTASGRTEPGKGWKVYTSKTIFIDVDTSEAGFTATPVYTTSIGGTGGSQYILGGVTGIYSATPTGFRIHVYRTDDRPLTPADAESYGWYVNWIGHQQAS
ncbi:isopeptide-forming domain-containing fimbrial protein [Nonomuraea insulae]|uniref:Isopeptide-forming domain-containing fimbrial protein n=1 Tax=Nonomuraea insulae TaxID=1616787 RepID=A0ABW1DB15_9ACTN